ncbi:MAG: T9SS type A sorting domain-containing protein, partial [Bacteroidota bacterium]
SRHKWLPEGQKANWINQASNSPSGLPEAIYDVTAISRDIAGNSNTDTSVDELEVDLTAPVVTVTSFLTQVGSPELGGSVDDLQASVAVSVSGNTYSANNNGDNTWTLPAGTISPTLIAGVYDVDVTATDIAGNIGNDTSVDELVVAGAPQANAATDVQAFSFTANWDPVQGISSYAFEVSRNNTFTDLVAGFDNVAVAGNSQNVTGLDYGTAYFYRLRSIIAPGDTSLYSNAIAVLTDTPAGTIADSIALSRFYSAMGGPDWTDNANWNVIDQRIETWSGVTVVNGRVTAIDLAGNNLSGDLPIFETGEFSELASLRLNGNNITSLSDLTLLSSLSDLQVQNNRLDFASITGNTGIAGIVYSPQQVYLEMETLFVNEGDNASIDRSSGNVGDEYRWFRDGVEIAGETNETLELTAVSFENEGAYNAAITNSGAPLLTLLTAPVILKVSSLERDSVALLNVYVALDGDNWSKEGTGYNWLTDPILSWRGLTFDGSRVTGLDLSNSEISGSMPEDILDVLNLTTIDISGNDIEDIPDMTSLDQLVSLNLNENLLQFDDLLPNVDINGVTYLDQELADIATADTLSRGSDFELQIAVGGVNNVYEWKLDTNPVEGAPSEASLQLTDLRRANTGTYTVEVTNPGVPGLRFISKDKIVLAKAFIAGTVRSSETEVFTDAIVKFFIVKSPAYDTIQVDIPIASDGSFAFETVLEDYVVIASPDELDTFIPTYHSGTIQWDEANVVPLNNDTTNIDIVMVPVPVESPEGDGTASGLVETNFDEETDDTDGRIEARRKARRVGVALRRRRSSGRTEDDDFELFAYTQTDDEGLFSFENLPAGVYRIFIEYPGIPIREDAFTEFEVTEDGKNNDVTFEATVEETGIAINGKITGVLKDLIDDLVIYPNPATSGEVFVGIEASRSFEVVLEIVDLRGKTVLAKTLNNVNIGNGNKRFDVSHMPAGLYLIRVTAPTQQNQMIYSGKLIIQNK